MERVRSSENTGTIETTIGDLIAAISEIALAAGKTEEEGYELASMTLEYILRTKSHRPTLH
ncbi:MAG: hypothetical protein QY326_04765 [Bdellovibrionota bacterium]|nr:MAG: hypothetical protein QY326_04765 [Bdellovibrionota bacterium]